MTLIYLLSLGISVLGLSLMIADYVNPHKTCSPPEAIDIVCLVDYPGGLTVIGTVTFLVGAILFIRIGTRRDKSHVPMPEAKRAERL